MARQGSGRAHAFIVEALVLLALLALCSALILQVFGAAQAQSRHAHVLTMQTHIAANLAERFAANPQGVPVEVALDASGRDVGAGGVPAYRATLAIEQQQRDGGVLYECEVRVSSLQFGASIEPVSLQTARYVPGDVAGGVGAAGAATGAAGAAAAGTLQAGGGTLQAGGGQ